MRDYESIVNKIYDKNKENIEKFDKDSFERDLLMGLHTQISEAIIEVRDREATLNMITYSIGCTMTTAIINIKLETGANFSELVRAIDSLLEIVDEISPIYHKE